MNKDIDEMMVTDAKQRWDEFFQKTLQVDLKLNHENNAFINHSENGIDIEATQQELDQYINCLIQIPKLYTRLKQSPDNAQKKLIFTVAAYIAKDEKKFIRTNENDTYRMLATLAEISQPGTDTHVKVSYIDMLCSLFTHATGLRWSLKTNFWTEIFDLVLECQSKSQCLAHKVHNLLSKLLQKTSRLAPKICIHIIKQMVQGLMKTAVQHAPNTKTLPIIPIEPTYYHSLTPSISCLIETLERLLSSPNTDTIKLFIKLQVREACDTLAILSENEEFSLLLIRIMILLSFYEMTDLFDGIKVVNHDPLALSGCMRIIERELKKGHFKAMYKMYYYAQKYWKNVSRKMPKYFVKEKSIDIEDEIMSLQMEPMIIIAEKLLGAVLQRTEEQLRSCYLVDLLNMCSEYGLHLGYEIRKYFPQHSLEIEIIALECIVKSKPFYLRKNLAIVFQGLIYAFRDFNNYVKKHPTKGAFEDDEMLAEAMLQAILVYLENFDLSWRESIGSIELTNLVYDFLYYSTRWSAEIIVKALKILNTTISKHMSPNMALLVDTTQHSSLNELGSLLFKKCFSNNSEVRNTTLIVVCTICQEANKGFRSFKKIIMESLLQDLILKMALSDIASTVRTTALKCLQEIIVMDDVGKTLLNSNFVVKILEIIVTDQDPMVVKEAIVLIGKLYQIDEISDQDIQKIYNVMVQVGLKDESEVQKPAIEFWGIVTDKQFEKHGMLDDTFPPVIFSKEDKKIIRMDDKEIRKRIYYALDSLSQAGCFGVFQNVLQSEKVSKEVYGTTVNIVSKYIRLLQRYEINNVHHHSTERINKELTNLGILTIAVKAKENIQVTPEIILFNQAYPNLWSLQSSILMSPSYQFEDQNIQDIIEETVMEMINASECINNNIRNNLPETNSETGEHCHTNPVERAQVNTVDFIDFIYKKLPYLVQTDGSECT